MNYDSILIRYGEISLKGRNRNRFEKQLMNNIISVLSSFQQLQIIRAHQRMYIQLNGDPYAQVKESLQKVFGIRSFSPTKEAPLELQAIQQTALQVVRDMPSLPKTFKVEVRRANKLFPHPTQEMNRLVGAYVLRNIPELSVDVHQPEMKLNVEIREEGTYIYSQVVYGMGGLPTGSSGKAMLMLSGGIDSPVAGFLTMKRGVQIEAVHFHSFPYTSERAKQKVIDLTRVLSKYCGPIHLHLVPFTKIQTEIRKHSQPSLSITVMRRMMMRIAEQLAKQRGAVGITTGESLGQVASQTLESMQVIHRVMDMPIIQPVITMDKAEIIEMARHIGTYELSILPYEDCCTVFLPKSPATRPNLFATERSEHKLDVDTLIEEAITNTEVEVITPNQKEEQMADYF
jgi:thiamine biosynthesis protein ThiI